MPIANQESDTIVNLRGLRALWLHGCPFPSGPEVEDTEVLASVRTSELNASIPVHTQLFVYAFEHLKLDCRNPRFAARSRTGRGESSRTTRQTWKIRGDLG